MPRFFFFFNDTATTEIYTLSLHDALPISSSSAAARRRRGGSGTCRTDPPRTRTRRAAPPARRRRTTWCRGSPARRDARAANGSRGLCSCGRLVDDAALHDEVHVLGDGDVLGRVARDRDHVGEVAGREPTQ